MLCDIHSLLCFMPNDCTFPCWTTQAADASDIGPELLLSADYMSPLCMNQTCGFGVLSVPKACATMQPIKVETSPGHVEIALLHVIESEGSSHTDLRVAAIYDRSPIHTFLFDSEGGMLTATRLHCLLIKDLPWVSLQMSDQPLSCFCFSKL